MNSHLRNAALLAIGALAGCAETTPANVERPTVTEPSSDNDTLLSFDTAHWGAFHSKRFGLTLPVPEPKNWAVDDHSQRDLMVRHAKTRSFVQMYATTEPSLVNRQRCEERARALGIVPATATKFTTVEDEPTVGPGAYDTRVWVAIAPGATDKDPIVGHVFAFGGYVRKCLFFHFQTEVASARDESALSARLALVRTRVLGSVALDDFDSVPKENVRNVK
ncbi:hypothetical protein LZC95_04035 [Pendulispora brunnea]|uniref:Uncharacterized protein n=1 Tax=Pendulispora brunnea TaxID=2905690 RepID=A0ABZ2KER0_9BACT